MKYFPHICILLIFLGPMSMKVLTCNPQILRYYGFDGLEKSIKYKAILPDISANNCPKIINSCCSSDDWDKTTAMWQRASDNISKSIQMYFELIKSLAIAQREIFPFISQMQKTGIRSCKKIDNEYIRNPMELQKLLFIIKSSFETFAIIQRGFYCMICDQQYHTYFNVQSNNNRLMIAVDSSFCPLLINIFKDFLNFKLFYFDPMIINMNNIIDCSDGKEKSYFDSSYRVQYDQIIECLKLNKNCDKICNEFRFGSSNNLFIGRISEYKKTLNEFERILKKYKPNYRIQYVDGEIDEPDNFEFFNNEMKRDSNNQFNGNLTRYDILLQKKGVNPFQISMNSGFVFTQADVTPILTDDGQKVHVLTPEEQKNNILREAENKMASLDSFNGNPGPIEVSGLIANQATMESEYIQNLKDDANNDPYDMSAAGIKTDPNLTA